MSDLARWGVFAPLVGAPVFKTGGGFEQSSLWVRFPYTPVSSSPLGAGRAVARGDSAFLLPRPQGRCLDDHGIERCQPMVDIEYSEYLARLAIPTALLFLGQLWLLVALLPQLGTNMISDYPSTVSPLYHYSAPVIAVLVAASVIGVGLLPPRFRVAAAGTMLGLGLLTLLASWPTPGAEAYLAPERETVALPERRNAEGEARSRGIELHRARLVEAHARFEVP